MTPSIYVPVAALTLPTLTDRGSPNMSVLARLAPGDTAERARAAVTALCAELERRHPEMNEGMSQPAQVFAAAAMQLRGTLAGFRGASRARVVRHSSPRASFSSCSGLPLDSASWWR